MSDMENFDVTGPGPRGVERRIVFDAAYEGLFDTLAKAFLQAAAGKGAERHGGGPSFEDQPIFWIAEEFGDGFLRGQAVKKIHESQRLEPVRAVAELRGAIVYLAAMIMRLEGKA